MEVVGWSPLEKRQDPDASQLPPQVEGWTGGGEPRCVLTNPSNREPLIHNPLPPPPSLYAGLSSPPLPKPPSPRFESATAHQRRIKDPEHVPRPRNAFIIFRCHYTQKYLASGGSERTSETEKTSLSKRAGDAWKNAKPETKRYYRRLADEERTRHRIEHPDYRFRPKRQKSAGQTGAGRSSKRRANSPHSKRAAGCSSSVSSAERTQVSRNDPLQIQTITVPVSSSSLSQPYLSRQPTPEFLHGYGSTTPTSPYSPLSPVDDILYMPRPTIAASRFDSFPPYTTDDSLVSVQSPSLRWRSSDDYNSSTGTLSSRGASRMSNHTPSSTQCSRTTIRLLPPSHPRLWDGTGTVGDKRRAWIRQPLTPTSNPNQPSSAPSYHSRCPMGTWATYHLDWTSRVSSTIWTRTDWG